MIIYAGTSRRARRRARPSACASSRRPFLALHARQPARRSARRSARREARRDGARQSSTRRSASRPAIRREGPWPPSRWRRQGSASRARPKALAMGTSMAGVKTCASGSRPSATSSRSRAPWRWSRRRSCAASRTARPPRGPTREEITRLDGAPGRRCSARTWPSARCSSPAPARAHRRRCVVTSDRGPVRRLQLEPVPRARAVAAPSAPGARSLRRLRPQGLPAT